MKKNILFLLSLFIVMFSCQDDEEPVITINQTEITVSDAGGSESIYFESNMNWIARSSENWCAVSPSSGDASTKGSTVTFAANDTYIDRSSVITITSGSLTKTITVNQTSNLGLLVTQDKYDLSNDANTIEVEVKTNVDFDVTTSEDWIINVTARSMPSNKLTFDIAKNESYDSRSGYITIKQKDGTLESTIIIYQSQEDAIILSKKTENILGDSQTLEVELKTNVDFEVIIPEVAKNWVSFTPTRALRTETLLLDIAENEEGKPRTTEIYIKNKATSLQDTLTIIQSANLAFSINPNKFELTNDAITIEVDVETDFEFDVIIEDDWITDVTAIDPSSTKLIFNIAKNESYDNREGFILINQKDGPLSNIITIYQSQLDAIILKDIIKNISDKSQTLSVQLQTNIDFEVIIPEAAKSWVSYTPTRALRTETLSLNITRNEGDEGRSTEITIKSIDTDIQKTFTINQSGKEPAYVYWVNEMGTLNTMLNQTQKDTITTMVVKGEINKADFIVMKEEMPKLRHLDLKNVKCENNEIPSEALRNNQILTTVILPDGIKSIGSEAFRNCQGLTGSLTFPNELISIGFGAFHTCQGLTGSLDFPDGLEVIESEAFRNCKSLDGTLTLPHRLKKIGSEAFLNCENLTGAVVIPESFTKIEKGAFSNCKGLTSLTLPEGLITIEDHAFRNIKGFTSLTLPEGLISIGAEAFRYCSNIKGIILLPESLTSIGAEALIGSGDAFRFQSITPVPYTKGMLSNGANVQVPVGALSEYQNAPGWDVFNIAGY